MGRKAANKPVVEKETTENKTKKSGTAMKRGQPTAAARLVSSSYINYGWHIPLSGETKSMVQKVSPIADSMYMLQIRRDSPVSFLSIRNAIFWEHRQLPEQDIVSTPAVDHLDLFPYDDAAFRETMHKLAPVRHGSVGGNFVWSLHYVYETIRNREFLLLPVEVGGCWVTIVARIRPQEPVPGYPWQDREATDVAIIDPLEEDWEVRGNLIRAKLQDIFNYGFIKTGQETTYRRIGLAPAHDMWETGLIAFAVSREFLRRMRVLSFRRDCFISGEEFLWADFEEKHNLDAYRQMLLSACAHQCIETSGHQLRLAIEVPSDGSNYHPDHLARPSARNDLPDEKWDVFQSATHTTNIEISKKHKPMQNSELPYAVCPEITEALEAYEGPGAAVRDGQGPKLSLTPGPSPRTVRKFSKSIMAPPPRTGSSSTGSKRSIASVHSSPKAPMAPMSPTVRLSPRIPGLNLIPGSVGSGQARTTDESPRKQQSQEESPRKRRKTNSSLL
ncbi:hypothetical protein GGS20DRAFT_197216 [Poronia punctata]|nr:hypothetical protein GGS20DRAFT_197216 [Poronia punctata]